MSNKVRQLAEQFIGAAKRASSPEQAAQILRRGASTFAGLASDPQNVKAAKRLTAIGLDFAGAAAQAQERAATTSDFTQLMRDTAQAWEELGPGALSMNATQNAQAIQRTNTINEMPGQFVSIQPHTFLNKDATLGRSASVTFNPTPEQVVQGILSNQTLAFWQGAKNESQAMTVDIGTVIPAIQAAVSKTQPQDLRPFATIQYGADGNTQNTIAVDVGLGRRVTVVGNYISVNVALDPPRDGGSSPVVTIGASIGTFAAPSQAPIIRSVYFDFLDSGVFSKATPIPLRAVRIFPPVPPVVADTLSILFLTINGSPLVQWQFTYAIGTPFCVPFVIPVDAFYFQVKSATGVGVLGSALRIPFELSL